MSQGDKSKYTDKQKRKAEHIADSYESRGVPEAEAEARAWATVNKDQGVGRAYGGGALRLRKEGRRDPEGECRGAGVSGGDDASKDPGRMRPPHSRPAGRPRPRRRSV